MTTNNPTHGLATDQQGVLPTDGPSVHDLQPGADTEGVRDNDGEEKPGLTRPPFPASSGRMMLGRPPQVFNPEVPVFRQIAAADAAVTGGTTDQIMTEVKADAGATEQVYDTAGTGGSPNAAYYVQPVPVPCPFCWTMGFSREKFWEVGLFVR